MTAPRRVLVVDDELGTRDLARYILEPLGHVVSVAANGAEALRLFEAEPYDVVLLDVHMPGISGREVLGALLARRPRTRVVIVSSGADGSLATWAPAAGAAAYLHKPVDMDDLIRVVEEGGAT